MSNVTKVDIQILGRNYHIQCREDEVENLQTAASHVNYQMHDMRKQAPSLEHDKLLVLTSLNLCRELFEAQKNEQDAKQSARLLEKMIIETKQMLRD